MWKSRSPPDAVGELFAPFRRAATDRIHSTRGHGLGLSIVDAVAGRHHGHVRADARPEGGLVVSVELDRRAP